MKKGKLIIVSAPSGAGKTTLVKYLLEIMPELDFSVSCATREPRENEVDKKDYYFISEEKFREFIEENAFAEWEEVYPGNFYGTLKSEIHRIWENGKAVIFDIDGTGGINLKNLYPENSLSIFILPPSIEELENRLRSRNTETEQKLRMRIVKSEKEILLAPQFDVSIVNEELYFTKKDIKSIVEDFLNS